MKKLLLFALLLSICIVGCDRGKPDSRLVLADSLIEPRPDSAYTILKTIVPDELSGKGNRALYALLLTQAEYKLFDSVATDSLIDVAVDYYQSGRDAEKRTRSYLYKSAELLSSGDQVGALEWLKRAESVADTSDYALLARINYWMSDLYSLNYIQNDKQIEKYKKALYYYKKAGKKAMAYACASQLGAHYRLSNQDSARKYLEEGITLAKETNDTADYFRVLRFIARNYELSSEYEKEKDLSVYIIRYGRKYLYDNNSYYDVAYAYAKLGMPDSALYYLNLEDKHPLTGEEELSRQVVLKAIALQEGDYRQAYKSVVWINDFMDSIDSISLQRQLFSIEKRFDKKQAEYRNLELKQERTLWSALFFCVTTVCLVLAIVIVRRRHRLREYRQLVEQVQGENRSMKSRLFAQLEKGGRLESAFSGLLDNIRELIDMSYRYADQPVLFSKKFKERIQKSKLPDDFWRDFRYFVDMKYGRVLSRLQEAYPELSDEELHFVGLMCCGFSYVEIAVCMGYSNPNYVNTKKARIAKKMNLSEPLKDYLLRMMEKYCL